MFPSLLALLFILKIRLGANSNIVNFITSRYGEEGKRLYRRYESTKKKHVKTCLDLEFLVKCKTYNVIPKFLRFKLYKRSLRSASFYRSWQTKLLNYEINCKKKEVNRLSLELKENYSNVNNLCSFIDSALIVQNINAYLKKY